MDKTQAEAFYTVLWQIRKAQLAYLTHCNAIQYKSCRLPEARLQLSAASVHCSQRNSNSQAGWTYKHSVGLYKCCSLHVLDAAQGGGPGLMCVGHTASQGVLQVQPAVDPEGSGFWLAFPSHYLALQHSTTQLVSCVNMLALQQCSR